MAIFTVQTPFNIELEFQLAPFYKRMLAWMIDLVLIFLYSYLMMFFIYGMLLEGERFRVGNGYNAEFILGLFTVAIPVMAYQLLFEVFMNGRSPGKWLMGIKVINKDGASATLSQLLLRWILFLPNYFLLMVLGMYVPQYFLGITLALAFAALPDIISVLVSKYGQRIGDLAAGTVVVDTRHKADINDTIFVATEDSSYVPVYPQVLQLSDRDINVIKNLLKAKINKDVERHTYKVAYKIKEMLQVEMNGDPYGFLGQLLKDYNYLTRV